MKFVSFCLFFVLVSFCTATLVVNIELPVTTFSVGDTLIVNWELENTGNPLAFLKWGTPLEHEWNADIFRITGDNGHQATYEGRLLKRVAPVSEDFFPMLANQVVSGSSIISEGYTFRSTGTYDVSLSFVVTTLSGESYVIHSNTIAVTVNSVSSRVFTRGGQHQFSFRLPGSRVNFNGCSSSEQSVVNAAISNAISASSNALSYLSQSGNPPNCVSDFEKWFGSYTSSNWNTIESDFKNINNQLSSKNFGIDCTCNQPGTYAYVYPTDKSHTIYLCPVFWSASSDKYTYNSQPGTLTHEMSHFNDIAGTQDYQYGVSGCIQLAKDNPSLAVNNADSHEYLQESDPTC